MSFFNHVLCCRGGPRGTQMPDLLSPAFLDEKDLNIIQVFLIYNLFHCFQIKNYIAQSEDVKYLGVMLMSTIVAFTKNFERTKAYDLQDHFFLQVWHSFSLPVHAILTCLIIIAEPSK